MGQVLQFQPRQPIGHSEPIGRKAYFPEYRPVRPTVRESIAWLFFDGGRSVRSIHATYRRECISEHQIEDVLREHHRSRLAVAVNTGRLRAAMERKAA